MSSHQVAAPVVSVGNLTVGGTGKTPMTEFLLRLFKDKGLRVAVLSRGYRGTYRKVTRVPSTGEMSQLAVLYGDEPTWLARTHPDVPIYVGRDRVRAAKVLLSRELVAPQILLLDDAFQHRRLRRNLDLVLVDASEPVSALQVMPTGRGREGLYALKRASAILLNKTNYIDASAIYEWHRFLRSYLRAETPILDFGYQVKTLIEPLTGAIHRVQELHGERVFLISALAKPNLFEDLIRQELGAEIAGHHRYSDHHHYSKDDWQRCLQAAEDSQWIVTTQKDVTKLRSEWLSKVLVTQLEITCSPETRAQIYEMVVRKMS
jgi:tetraacyldisaccharide 4'-kinase